MKHRNALVSRKPYRTKAQKALAREMARKCADGAWRSNAPFRLHGEKGNFVWGPDGEPVRVSDDPQPQEALLHHGRRKNSSLPDRRRAGAR